MIEFSGRLWVQNWHFSIFLCHCFDFLHGPWLFRACFRAKTFSKRKFSLHYNVGSTTILIESLKFRKNFQIAVSSPSILYEYVNMSFLNIIICYYFSLEAVLQSMAENNPTRKQIDAEFQGHQSMRQRENSQKRKCKVYCYKLQR